MNHAADGGRHAQSTKATGGEKAEEVCYSVTELHWAYIPLFRHKYITKTIESIQGASDLIIHVVAWLIMWPLIVRRTRRHFVNHNVRARL